MQPLVSAAQMQEIDRRTITEMGLPDILLMEHAALGVCRALERRFGDLLTRTRGVILAGTGNNGGDALALARILDSKGVKKIFVGLVGEESRLSPATLQQKEILGRLGVPVFWPKKPEAELFESCDWIVDGLFGTGLSRDIGEPFLPWIETTHLYQGKKWIVAIDIPSGLNSDTGRPMGSAVMASETVTLGFIKQGLVTGAAADYVGQLTLEPIQIPRLIPFSVDAFLYDQQDAMKLPRRRPSSHKGSFGHVYLWASEEDKQGACILSALGALRSGAGLVTVVGEEDRLKALRQRLPPEIMTQTQSKSMWESQSGIWIQGPGMGCQDEGKQALRSLADAIQAHWPCVIDADALTVISQDQAPWVSLFKKAKPGQIILTPHPKEAARLLGKTVEAVEKERYHSVRELAAQYQATVVLKGKGTLIQAPSQPCICVTTGDTGLSKGGTGDLLTGMLGALLAQGLSTEFAVPLGVYLHGLVSERVTQIFGHPRSTLATDLANQIPMILKEWETACR